MRKIVFFMLTSLDGYFEAPGRNIDWHTVDEEFNEFAEQQTSEFGALLFGRVTYELMASYWPTDAAKQDDPVIAGLMNQMPKFVFSTTLQAVEWENTELVKTDFVEVVTALKQESGKDVAIFGSSDLTVSLMAHDLIDEYRIMINPIILGEGRTVFDGIHGQVKLNLINVRTFKNGNVLLSYEPRREA